MATQSPLLTTYGDLNRAKRKLSGESLVDDVWPQATKTRSPLLPDPGGYSGQRQPSVQPGYSVLPPASGPQQKPASSPLMMNRPLSTQAGIAGDPARWREAADNVATQAVSGAHDQAAAHAAKRQATLDLMAEKRREGENGGNARRAAIMREQFSNPVYGPGNPRPSENRIADYVEGGVKLSAGVFGSPGALAIDKAREGIAYLRGTTLENPHAARDVTGRLMTEGVEGYGRAFKGAGEVIDQAIGAKPRPASAASQPAIPSIESQPAPAAQPGAATQAPQATQKGQWYMAGDGIAARVGQNGVPEFSNDATAVGSAQAMPAGGIGGQPLRRPGVSNIADDVPLAQRGSINNIGNGIGGGISFGQAGDAANAIAQYEAANAIRREQLPGVRVSGTGYQNPLTAGQAITQRRQDRRDAARQELSLRERELGIQERRGIADDQVAQRTAQFEQQKLAQQGAASGQKLLGDLARAFGSMKQLPQVELGDGKTRDVTFEEWARPMLGGIGGPALSRRSVTKAEVERTAKARGVSEDQVTEMLRDVGVSVNR